MRFQRARLFKEIPATEDKQDRGLCSYDTQNQQSLASSEIRLCNSIIYYGDT